MLPVPVAATLLIPVTAARLHPKLVPVVLLLAAYENATPLVAVAVRLLDSTGITLGAATLLPAGLTQPLTV